MPKTDVEYKYTVAEVAKECDLEPASVRVAFRKLGVKKTKEGVYGWNDHKEFLKVCKDVKEAGRGSAKEEKPAKAKSTKAPTKKAA